MRSVCTTLVCLVLPLALVGCGDANTAVVSGLVTFDGKAIETGAITFTPVDGEGWTAGGTIKNGSYSVRVPLATFRVSITAPMVVGTKKIYDTPDSPVMPITREALPEKYNEQTELKIEVKSTMRQDFNLQSP